MLDIDIFSYFFFIVSYILVIHVIKGQEHDILSCQNKIFIFGYKNLNCRRLTQQFTHASLTSYVHVLSDGPDNVHLFVRDYYTYRCIIIKSRSHINGIGISSSFVDKEFFD